MNAENIVVPVCENDVRSETFLVVAIVMLLSFLSNSSTIPLWWWRENQVRNTMPNGWESHGFRGNSD